MSAFPLLCFGCNESPGEVPIGPAIKLQISLNFWVVTADDALLDDMSAGVGDGIKISIDSAAADYMLNSSCNNASLSHGTLSLSSKFKLLGNSCDDRTKPSGDPTI